PVNSFLLASYQSLVHLYAPAQPIAARAHHGAAQFMQQRPGRLVALQAQHTLQADGTDAVLLAGHPPHGTKPQGQRQATVLKDRPGGNRALVVTTGTAHKTVGLRPALRLAAARAPKTVRPTKLKQVLPARRFRRKACLQLRQISRIILHGQKHYRLWLRESSKYPSGAILGCAGGGWHTFGSAPMTNRFTVSRT